VAYVFVPSLEGICLVRNTARLVRHAGLAAALALIAAGAASAPALADTSPAPITLTASDATPGAALGQSVAISANGQVAAVGASEQNTTGAVYIFRKKGNTFTRSAELYASDGQNSDQVGSSVAISADGNTVVAGAIGEGADYVFTRIGGTWRQTAKLVASGDLSGGALGTSVAISANASTIVIGDPFGGGQNGGAYVFTRDGGTYIQKQVLTPTDNDGVQEFGQSVTVSGDGSTIVVGAFFDNGGQGAVDVFTESGGAWAQTAHFVAANAGPDDNFGASVAVSGNGRILAVGSPQSDNFLGSAYVFTQAGGTWKQASQLLPPANSGALPFGSTGNAVGISANGSVVAIGAPSVNNFNGAIFVADESHGTWAITATENPPSTVADANFGFNNAVVAANGSAIVAGAPGAGDAEQGEAFVFPLS
jgi:FG-GAP repeat